MAHQAPHPARPPAKRNFIQRWLAFNYYLGEYVTMLFAPRDKPGPILSRLFRIPLWLYAAGLSGLVSGQVLLLTTTGRKTRLPRTTPLGYTYDPAGPAYIVSAGWQGRTDWFRNARANPHVRVRVGDQTFDAVAEQLPDERVMALLAEYARLNPFAGRMYARWSGVPFDGTEVSLRAMAPFFPMLALRPAAPS